MRSMPKPNRAQVFIESVKLQALEDEGFRNPIEVYLAVLGLEEMPKRFHDLNKFKKICYQHISSNTVRKLLDKLSRAKELMAGISSSDFPRRFRELRDCVLDSFNRETPSVDG